MIYNFRPSEFGHPPFPSFETIKEIFFNMGWEEYKPIDAKDDEIYFKIPDEDRDLLDFMIDGYFCGEGIA